MCGKANRGLRILSSVALAALLAGCAYDARPKKAVLSGAPDRELVKPGMVGNNAPADRRRGFFDFWNEEIVRENVAVGTVFMGDSITELWELGAYFVPSDGLIVNRGISGDLASVMAQRFEADVVQLRPRNVVILAGTNDVSRMKARGVSDEEVISSVVDSLTTMVTAAQAAGIRPLVCAILPTNPDCKEDAYKKACVPKINELVRRMCREKGCIHVDYAARLTDANGDLPRTVARDGLHPHYAGYRIMRDVLIETATRNGIRL